jgi:FkbM family methyltransferase
MRKLTSWYPFVKGRNRLSRNLSRLFPIRKRTVVLTREGLELELPPADDSVARQLYWFGSFDVYETQFLTRTLKPGMVALDVGAHLGTHCLHMAQRVGPDGHVVAFEPESRNVELLRRNVERNGFLDRVTVVQAAVADHEQEADLVLEHGTGNWVRLGDDAHLPNTERIRCISIDQYLKDNALTRVDFIKSDTEGAELLVLQGAEQTLSAFHPVLLVEFAARHLARFGVRAEDILDYLRKRDYEAYVLTSRKVRALRVEDDISDRNVIFRHQAA